MANTSYAITQKQKEDYEKQLTELKTVELVKANDALNLARSQGDLYENADYDAAIQTRNELQSQIAHIQDILDHCTIISEEEFLAGSKTVKVSSSIVTVEKLDDGKKFTFTISGAGGGDGKVSKSTISNVSPVGQALLGHKVGDVVTIKAKVTYQMKILSIELAKE